MKVTLELLAIPTAHRPSELHRAVSSFVDHFNATGHRVPIVVFHSPANAAEQAAVQDAVQSAGALAPGVEYVGLTEKLAFAKDLRRATKVPPALLDLALFNPSKHPQPVGANRNAALLWSAGQRFLSCDDDTTADLYAHPDSTPDARLQRGISSAEPCDCFVPADGMLEAFRIRSGDPRWPEYGLPGALSSIWEAAAALGSPAPLALLGLSGDCGWSAPFGFFGMPLGYLQLRPETLARLAATPEQWRATLSSRTMLKVVPGPRLVRGAPGMTTAIGIDATEILPPFIPIGRGQDLLFCAMTERLRGSSSAHVPLAVAHRPAAVRRFHEGELWRAAQSLDLCRTLFALLESVPVDADLVGLGRHLKEQTGTTVGDFEAAVREGRRAQSARLCSDARAYAAAQDGLPAWWRADLLAYCDRTERAVSDESPLWILDAGTSDPGQSLENARALVQGYGALCEAWPDLFRAARERSRDHGVTRQPARAVTAASAPARCSPYQTWLWRLHRIDPADNSFVIVRRLRGRGPVRRDLLEQALQAVAERHEVLRCRFPAGPDNEPLLDLRAAGELRLEIREPLGAEARAEALRAARRSPFDLVGALPLRAVLVPYAEDADGWELWLSFHHVAVDGAAEARFWHELDTTYANLLHGQPAADGLRPLAIGFRALAQQQRDALTTVDEAALELYWRRSLEGAPELRISWRDPSARSSSDSFSRTWELPSALVRTLSERSRELRVSVAAIVLAAWQALLCRWSGETDIVVGVPFANRFGASEDEHIALFMNALSIRAGLDGDPTLGELAVGNRGRLAEALKYGRIPGDRVARGLDLGRGRLTFFDVLFTYQSRTAAPRLEGAAVELLQEQETQGSTNMSLNITDSGDRITATLSGRAALFDESDLRRIGDALVACLEQLGGDPDRRLSAIAWLSSEDHDRLADWNATSAAAPLDQALPVLLRQQLERAPDAIALDAAGERITYRDLFGRADRLAARLRGHGVMRDAVVALFIDRSPNMLVAMLGILEAGGAYLPLDPAWPSEKLAFMVEDSGARVLVTARQLASELPLHRARVIAVDDDEAPLPAPADWQPPDADSLAYVLYTSGSTGQPKGVEIPHRALVNFLCSMARSPGLASNDVLLALTTFSFDIAGLELWLPLLTGARIALAGREEAGDGALLQQALARSGATVLQATPTTWRALFASGWSGSARLKGLVGGEALPQDLAQRLSESCAEAWNLYGPTETTIWSAAWRIPKGDTRVRIGRPIANTQLHVLDSAGQMLPPGVTGDLFIGGEGLARGYRGRPEMTSERFVPDPFRRGGRLYRTGDLARWLPDGELDFRGRNDDQLKLHGHRIEPGEIEAALHQLDEIEQAVVDLRREAADEARLIAYVVVKPGATLPSSAELRARLRLRLTHYSLPHQFVDVPTLPLTSNGKVDRRKLGGLYRPPAQESGSVQPHDALEAALMNEFADLLRVRVGPHTDFFEAGGDSLLGLQLVNRLSRHHPTTITGGELFLHSTPRQLAARLRGLEPGGATLLPGRHLRLLREGNGAPIVFVHPVGGELLNYLQLAQHLPSGLPVFGLEASGVDAPFASLTERCAAYAAELQRVSAGPFYVGGFSLGGVLALELAAQLQSAGRVVRFVFLLDTFVPAPREGLVKVRDRFGELQRYTWGQRWFWVRMRMMRVAGNELDQGRLIRALKEQSLSWRPPVYTGPLLLFRTERDMEERPRRPSDLRWDTIYSQLEVITVAANHDEMMAGSPAARIADEIGRRIT